VIIHNCGRMICSFVPVVKHTQERKTHMYPVKLGSIQNLPPTTPGTIGEDEIF
jgi:hypothetical protein